MGGGGEHNEKMFWGTPPPPNKFVDPPPKKIIWSGMKKIKVVPNDMKCRENWSNVDFVSFPPPPKKKCGTKKLCLSKMNETKLFQIT